MANPRFYCPEPIAAKQVLTLPESVAHHVRVLRLAAGSTIVLFDGHGGEIHGTLDLEGKIARVLLGEPLPREAEAAGQLTLLQALPAGDKMDWVIEKAVELGVHCVIPITAQRSVLQLSGPRLDKRLLHWQRIIEAAAEQCGRNRLMQLQRPVSLADALAQPASYPLFLCDPGATQDLDASLESARAMNAVGLLIGPEGGWSPQEMSLADKHGVRAVRFGPRILRSETAGLAMTAAVSALMGW